MKIGIIGSGMIGATLARLFVGDGHEVAVTNRQSPQPLRALQEELGAHLHPASVADAAGFGDVAVVAVPFGAFDQLPARAFAGKIVVDANNYYPDRDGHVPALDRDEVTSTELLAQHLADAQVIKAFNTMYYATLATAGDRAKDEDERLALYVAGDDARAKQVVADLINRLGFAAIDTGGLADGGRRPSIGTDTTRAFTTAPAR